MCALCKIILPAYSHSFLVNLEYYILFSILNCLQNFPVLNSLDNLYEAWNINKPMDFSKTYFLQSNLKKFQLNIMLSFSLRKLFYHQKTALST